MSHARPQLGPSAWSALRSAHKPCAIYATGEDVGVPLAAILRLLRVKDVFVSMRFENPDVGRTALKRYAFRSFMALLCDGWIWCSAAIGGTWLTSPKPMASRIPCWAGK